jgi:hypothetical protein
MNDRLTSNTRPVSPQVAAQVAALAAEAARVAPGREPLQLIARAARRALLRALDDDARWAPNGSED